MARLTKDYSSPFENGVPGPYVTVRITRGEGEGNFRELPALLDTGADITLVPIHTIEALNLQVVTDDLELHDGSGGITEDALMYAANLEFAGFVAPYIGIAATKAAIVYVGRDVLVDYVATFHGPGQRFSLD